MKILRLTLLITFLVCINAMHLDLARDDESFFEGK